MKTIIAIFCISLFLCACDSPNEGDKNATNEKKEETTLQNEYKDISSITFGSGGGFTGGWQGTTVQRDGKIFLVQKVGEEEQKDELATTPEKVMSIFTDLEKMEFLKIESQGVGNMTTNVYVSVKGEKKHEITFPMQNIPSPKLKELLQKIEMLVGEVIEKK